MSARHVYLDASALHRFVRREPGSDLLRNFLLPYPPPVSNAVARWELFRALEERRAPAAEFDRAERVLDRVTLVEIDPPLLRAAAGIVSPSLSLADSLHLASALELEDELASFVTYRPELAAAAAARGLAVASPGQGP